MMEKKVTIYSQTAAATLESIRRLARTPDMRPALTRSWQIVENVPSQLHRLNVAFYGCFIKIPRQQRDPTLDDSNVRVSEDCRILARQSETALGRLEYDPPQGSGLSLCGSFFSIPWWCIRFEGMNETSRDPGYFIDSSQERGLIGSRRFIKTADFSHELE
jgi:hypothetical protein